MAVCRGLKRRSLTCKIIVFPAPVQMFAENLAKSGRVQGQMGNNEYLCGNFA